MKKTQFLGERTLVRNNPSAKSYTLVLPAEVTAKWDLPYGTKVRVYMLDNGKLVIEPIDELKKNKLNSEEIEKIRKLYSTSNYKQNELGNMFGVCQQTISFIVNKKT